jgi:hypothetical protein
VSDRATSRMRLLLLVLLLDGLAVVPAWSQRFFPVLNPYDFHAPDERVERLQVGTFGTRWDLAPYRVSFRHGFAATAKVDASLLTTLDYFVNKHLSLGGWQNQLRASLYQKEYPDLPIPPRSTGSFNASYWDAHVTYYAPSRWGEWWAFQVGYSAVSSTSKVVNPSGRVLARAAGTLRSPNLWISRTQHVGGRSVKRHRHLVFLFGSLGYHTSGQFGHATNLMLGGAVDLSGRFTLSSSVWLNDFDDLAVRTTVGLVGRF